jgi:hypothetical protein
VNDPVGSKPNCFVPALERLEVSTALAQRAAFLVQPHEGDTNGFYLTTLFGAAADFLILMAFWLVIVGVAYRLRGEKQDGTSSDPDCHDEIMAFTQLSGSRQGWPRVVGVMATLRPQLRPLLRRVRHGLPAFCA